MTSLWENINYSSSIPYVINKYITEYDIQKANISVLFHEGVIDESTYNMLYASDRDYRERYIGIMEKFDNSVYSKLSEGIIKFKRLFCEANDLNDEDILSIKNDAIYVIGKKCKYTQFDNIIFNDKTVYTLFVRLNRLEIYYDYDKIRNNEIIDVKGINDNILPLHKDFMISFLCDVFYRLQCSTVEDAIKCCSTFYEEYVGRKLDIGFYREFNADSKYRINSSNSSFYLDDILPSYLGAIDISTNLDLLRSLYSILADIYIDRRRKSK